MPLDLIFSGGILILGTPLNFLQQMNWAGLVSFLVNVLAVVVCLTLHELSHGLAAYALGDPTAKDQGRLSLNPLRHIDLIGFVCMLVAGVGWARPVPVDLRYFNHPKRDMAITALAGPVSNLLTAVLAIGIGSLLYHLGLLGGTVLFCVFGALCNLAVLSAGLGLFNLIPIPPMDGSRVLFAFLPDRLYYTVMRYERYIMLALLLLLFFGVFSRPLNTAIQWVLSLLCRLTGLPGELLYLGTNFVYFVF